MIAHPAQPVDMTLEHFADLLGRLSLNVQAIDSEGVNHAIRLAVCESLYLVHDALRAQERPFDRAAFLETIHRAGVFTKASPYVRSGTGWFRAGQQASDASVTIADLYSRCWAKYSDLEFGRTALMFTQRLLYNDVRLWIDGEALDAGCGSGRYTFALATHTNLKPHGIDLSERAIREAEARLARMGYPATFSQGSVLEMPDEWTDRFEFVCSNGVVHHTPDPVKGLQEIYRVLKPGGQAFLMVYGKGGLFWALTDFCRELLSTVPVDVADAWLTMRNVPVGKVFFCLDHWYTPYQERVTREEFESRLTTIGFTDLQYLPRGYVYDASERYERYPEERDLIGSPDMRYLVRKP